MKIYVFCGITLISIQITIIIRAHYYTIVSALL